MNGMWALIAGVCFGTFVIWSIKLLESSRRIESFLSKIHAAQLNALAHHQKQKETQDE